MIGKSDDVSSVQNPKGRPFILVGRKDFPTMDYDNPQYFG